jgi:hypothetical protein
MIYYLGTVLETLNTSVISQAGHNSNMAVPIEYEGKVAKRKVRQVSTKHVEAWTCNKNFLWRWKI